MRRENSGTVVGARGVAPLFESLVNASNLPDAVSQIGQSSEGRGHVTDPVTASNLTPPLRPPVKGGLNGTLAAIPRSTRRGALRRLTRPFGSTVIIGEST